MFVCYNRYLYVYISYIFHNVAKSRIYGVVGYIIITLLQIVCKVCRKKNWKSVNNW